MQNLMLRLDAVIRRRGKVVLVLWLLAILAALPFALKQSEHLSGGGFTAPGSQSAAVEEALARDFPTVPATQLGIVLVPQPGTSAVQLRRAVERAAAAVEAQDDVELPAAARDRALDDAGRDPGRSLVLPLTGRISDDESIDAAAALRDRLEVDAGARDGVRPHVIGQGALWAGLQDLTKHDMEQAEAAGFPLVLLILLGVFGSFAAAALPLVLGMVSVLVTGALIYALSLAMDMSVFVTNMASMIGIGVAVDYSLFVLARYREEIRANHAPADARARAMATSGVAVLFSGVTVIVSLAGLWMVDNTAIRSMAVGAIVVVAVSLLASATLLPALIRLLGHRAYSRSRMFTVAGLVARSRARRRPGSTRPGRPPRPGFWRRWTDTVTRRPLLAFLAASALLLVLAAPVLDMRTANGALRQFPEGHEVRVGAEAAAAVTGAGATSPMRVHVRFERGTASERQNRAAVQRIREQLAADPGIAGVERTISAADGRSALVTATPATHPESDAAKRAVQRLRDRLGAPGAAVGVGGTTAQQEDVRNLINGSMWKILLFVLGLSYLVLLVLLRSVVLPLKAVVMNLLSVGAAYGVMVVVFQWGWADGFMGFESPGFIDSITPPIILAVVFGLSMDYEVFLLSRIRERFDALGGGTSAAVTRRAVAEGLASSARTITSAALIMVAVFAVFVGTGVPSIKQLGLGSAVAIALDATLVRLVLVPTTMELLGRWNWYLPRRLDRILPRSSFERLPEPEPQAAGASAGTAPERELVPTA